MVFSICHAVNSEEQSLFPYYHDIFLNNLQLLYNFIIISCLKIMYLYQYLVGKEEFSLMGYLEWNIELYRDLLYFHHIMFFARLLQKLWYRSLQWR